MITSLPKNRGGAGHGGLPLDRPAFHHSSSSPPQSRCTVSNADACLHSEGGSSHSSRRSDDLVPEATVHELAPLMAMIGAEDEVKVEVGSGSCAWETRTEHRSYVVVFVSLH
jgi:hypothetical protein